MVFQNRPSSFATTGALSFPFTVSGFAEIIGAFSAAGTAGIGAFGVPWPPASFVGGVDSLNASYVLLISVDTMESEFAAVTASATSR